MTSARRPGRISDRRSSFAGVEGHDRCGCSVQLQSGRRLGHAEVPGRAWPGLEVPAERLAPLLTLEQPADHGVAPPPDEEGGRRRPAERAPPVLPLGEDSECDDAATVLHEEQGDRAGPPGATTLVLEHDQSPAQEPMHRRAEDPPDARVAEPEQPQRCARRHVTLCHERRSAAVGGAGRRAGTPRAPAREGPVAGTMRRDRDRGRTCPSFTARGDRGDESTRGDTWLSPRKPSRS
jgi:hypothetical protein